MSIEDFVQSVIDGLVNPKPTTVPVHKDYVGKVTVPVIQAPDGSNHAVLKPAAAPIKIVEILPAGKWTPATMTAEILQNEGGYVNDPSDRGGATNYGITIGFMNLHKDFFGLQAAATNRDVQEITPAKAVEAYITFFLNAGHFDQIPNQGNIVMQLYDLAVNTGVRYTDGESPATKVLQHALNVTVDGVIGAATIASLAAAIAKSGVPFVNNAIVDARITYYGQVVAAHPQDAKFMDGWKRRALKYKM